MDTQGQEDRVEREPERQETGDEGLNGVLRDHRVLLGEVRTERGSRREV